MFIQGEEGKFADPVKIGPPTDMSRIYGADGYRYDPWSQSRIHEVDENRDARTDLVFWNKDHFEVHHQDKRGLFAQHARNFMREVAFDADDLDSLDAGNMTGKVLHSLADFNGDGVADLATVSLEGKSIARKRSRYEVHFGIPGSDGGTLFAKTADVTIQSKRIQIGMERHDFDRNGQLALMFTTINKRYLKNSLFKTIAGALGEDIWLDLEFYRTEGGLNSEKPNAVRRIQLSDTRRIREPGSVPLDVALRGGTHEARFTQTRHLGTFNAPLLVGDVTGDGLSDLLIGVTPTALDVFVGVPRPALFARQPQSVRVAMHDDREYTWLVDMNKDGTLDILLHHPSTTVPHRVTMLIAR